MENVDVAVVIDREHTDRLRRELLNYYAVLNLTEPMAKRRGFGSSPRSRKATGVCLTRKLPAIFPR